MPRPLEKKLPQLMNAQMIREELGLPLPTVRRFCDRLAPVHVKGSSPSARRLYLRSDVLQLFEAPDSRWRSID